MKTRAEMLSRLPAARREAVEKRTQELIFKERLLREVRKDQGLSQQAVAEAMASGRTVCPAWNAAATASS